MSPRKMAVGILCLGSGAVFGQTPLGGFTPLAPRPVVAAPNEPCATPPCGPTRPVHGKGGFGRVRAWFTAVEVPQAQPFGLSVTSHFDVHIQAGTAARMVFHDYDFLPDSSTLNHRGMDRVREVAVLMGENAESVVVERLPRDPALAEQRRLAVAAALGRVDPRAQTSRVVVASPPVRPLSGTDASTIYQTQTRSTASTGYLPSNAQGGGSGITTPTNGGGQTPGSSSPTPSGR